MGYGKHREEHALRWKAGVGFAHYEVDAGEYGRQVPFLLEDGAFDSFAVLKTFLELSSEVPKEIAEFVSARLREHPEYREDT